MIKGQDRQDRAAGALYGLAVGDALGMPTESLPRPEIVARYGPLLAEFRPGPPDQPLAPGLPAGTVTDDTEQALLLAGLIIEGDGAVDEAEFARRLLAWEQDMRDRGSLSLLGPSTKRALSALLAGTPLTETGRSGTTNGAAMRIAPVGVATPAGDPDLLVERVVRPAGSRTTPGSRWPGRPRSPRRSAREWTARPCPPRSARAWQRPGGPRGAGTGWPPPMWRPGSPGPPG